MKTTQIRLTSLAIAASLAGLLAGCGTTSGYKQADKTGAGISEFRTEIVNAKKAIDQTVQALNQVAVSANTDPRKPFEQFTKSLSKLESVAEKARKRGEQMKAQGKAYFDQWEKQLAEVNNPEIRRLADEQKTKLRATFASIKKYSEPLKAQFEPWLSDLKDLQKYLSNDLSVSGVAAAKDLFAKTQAEGVEVQKSMDALVGELNTVAATVTPAKVQAK